MRDLLVRQVKRWIPSRYLIPLLRCRPYLNPLFLFKRLCRAVTGKPGRIHCYPQVPVAGYMIVRIGRRLGCSIARAKQGEEPIIMRWEDHTEGVVDPFLQRISAERPIINLACNDISKQRVERIFTEVFGYSSHADPLVYEGVLIEKSDANGRHDGRFVQCPVSEMQHGCVYQIHLNTARGDGFREEFRIPVFRGEIVLVMKKIKPENDPFVSSIKGVMVDLDECLSAEEQAKICQFCSAFGLEYGELDILRNRDDDRIYIIDVNTTPAAYFRGVSRKEIRRITALQSKAFERAYLSRS